MSEFFTWAFLATFAGAVLGTTIVTQFVKGLGFLSKIPTQLVSYIIAVAILVVATAATGGGAEGWTSWAIIPLNAVLVSLSANGAYAGVQRITGDGLN